MYHQRDIANTQDTDLNIFDIIIDNPGKVQIYKRKGEAMFGGSAKSTTPYPFPPEMMQEFVAIFKSSVIQDSYPCRNNDAPISDWRYSADESLFDFLKTYAAGTNTHLAKAVASTMKKLCENHPGSLLHLFMALHQIRNALNFDRKDPANIRDKLRITEHNFFNRITEIHVLLANNVPQKALDNLKGTLEQKKIALLILESYRIAQESCDNRGRFNAEKHELKNCQFLLTLFSNSSTTSHSHATATQAMGSLSADPAIRSITSDKEILSLAMAQPKQLSPQWIAFFSSLTAQDNIIAKITSGYRLQRDNFLKIPERLPTELRELPVEEPAVTKKTAGLTEPTIPESHVISTETEHNVIAETLSSATAVDLTEPTISESHVIPDASEHIAAADKQTALEESTDNKKVIKECLEEIILAVETRNQRRVTVSGRGLKPTAGKPAEKQKKAKQQPHFPSPIREDASSTENSPAIQRWLAGTEPQVQAVPFPNLDDAAESKQHDITAETVPQVQTVLFPNLDDAAESEQHDVTAAINLASAPENTIGDPIIDDDDNASVNDIWDYESVYSQNSSNDSLAPPSVDSSTSRKSNFTTTSKTGMADPFEKVSKHWPSYYQRYCEEGTSITDDHAEIILKKTTSSPIRNILKYFDSVYSSQTNNQRRLSVELLYKVFDCMTDVASSVFSTSADASENSIAPPPKNWRYMQYLIPKQQATEQRGEPSKEKNYLTPFSLALYSLYLADKKINSSYELKPHEITLMIDNFRYLYRLRDALNETGRLTAATLHPEEASPFPDGLGDLVASAIPSNTAVINLIRVGLGKRVSKIEEESSEYPHEQLVKDSEILKKFEAEVNKLRLLLPHGEFDKSESAGEKTIWQRVVDLHRRVKAAKQAIEDAQVLADIGMFSPSTKKDAATSATSRLSMGK